MNSMCAFITSWFTPGSLFLLLNLIIATIVLSSRFGSQRRQEQQQFNQVPSFLGQLKSINFSLHKFDQPNADPVTDHFDLQPRGPEHVNTSCPVSDCPPPQIARSPSMLERLKSINLSSLYRSDSSARESEVRHPTDLNSNADHLVKRSKSDKGLGAPERPLEKIKKSASEKSPVGSSEEKETTSLEEDEEVDMKADDFISKFKQQLRLQRLDSLLRYRDLLKRN
ncbi:pathogen-associated molecular patterns-induced protein A70-like [Juglans regia]|uniref:Pathogen-associated molecular patterns-induced protein A70-like n=1 Tax=Juglans regia TaxID=51240 RepID=A0A6P9E4M1_JUGRE|nr:pathogen-associated molecular patterns-induced protein A70-like [Juglans regia]